MRRFIQNREPPYNLIPVAEFSAPAENRSALVMPDIAPYRSTITGEMIGSRSTHRKHLKTHGCVEIGNEKMEPKRHKIESSYETLKEAAHRAGFLRY